MTTLRRSLGVSLVALVLVGGAAALLLAGDPAESPRLFDSPDAAVKAFAEALKANDDAALKSIVGAGSDDLVQSGKDPIVARERRRVAALAAEKVEWDTLDDGTKVPVLGFKAWPMPVPLAKKGDKWFFDAEQGRDEVLARRIGAAELRTIAVMRALVEAQEAYKAKDRDGDGVLEYAQKFISTGDGRDGLFWLDAEDVSVEDRSPLGAMVEDLAPYLDGKSKGAPYGGYLFKMLVAQGAAMPGGAKSFLVGENLTGGYAIGAVPAEFRVTGVMSFLVGSDGRLLQKNLGPKGAELFKVAAEFNPDATWTEVGAK